MANSALKIARPLPPEIRVVPEPLKPWQLTQIPAANTNVEIIEGFVQKFLRMGGKILSHAFFYAQFLEFEGDTPIREPRYAPIIDKPPEGYTVPQWLAEMEEGARIAAEVYSIQQQIRQWEYYGIPHVANALRRQLEQLLAQVESVAQGSPVLGNVLKIAASSAAGSNAPVDGASPSQGESDPKKTTVPPLLWIAAAVMAGMLPASAYAFDIVGGYYDDTNAIAAADISPEAKAVVITIMAIGMMMVMMETAVDKRLHVLSNYYRLVRTPATQHPETGRLLTPLAWFAMAPKPSQPMADYSAGAKLLQQAEVLWESHDVGAFEQSLEMFKTGRDRLQNALTHFVRTENPMFIPTAELLAHAHLRLGNADQSSGMLYLAAFGHYQVAMGTATSLKDIQSDALQELFLTAELAAPSSSQMLIDEDPVRKLLPIYLMRECYTKALDLANSIGDEKAVRRSQLGLDVVQHEIDSVVYNTLHEAMQSPAAEKLLGDVISRWRSVRFSPLQVPHVQSSLKILEPIWSPFIGLSRLDQAQVEAVLENRMRTIFTTYRTRQDLLNKLHGQVDALRAAGESHVRDELVALARDWMQQAGFPYEIQIPTQLQIAQQRTETEARMRAVAAELEDPKIFINETNIMFSQLLDSIDAHVHHGLPVNRSVVISALADFIGNHPEWAPEFVDCLINHWRQNPDLIWQAVGEIVTQFPNRLGQHQLSQISSWAQTESEARQALQRIESAHPDIFLVGVQSIP